MEDLFQDHYVLGKILEILERWHKTTRQVSGKVFESKTIQLACGEGCPASVPLRKVTRKRQPLVIHWNQEIVGITSLCSYWDISNFLRIERLSPDAMTPIPYQKPQSCRHPLLYNLTFFKRRKPTESPRNVISIYFFLSGFIGLYLTC